jgi:hypothetical protein
MNYSVKQIRFRPKYDGFAKRFYEINVVEKFSVFTVTYKVIMEEFRYLFQTEVIMKSVFSGVMLI